MNLKDFKPNNTTKFGFAIFLVGLIMKKIGNSTAKIETEEAVKEEAKEVE